ncbi:hypothetical protein MWU60_16155 [Yoonia sp. F2084L]|uniref:hypothetical protein n=1 Tax=Yoonia sp. F2084L TaxID=2926419 RepID=UPI001FF2AAE2|nr:hypothetical protein [Yoonia sp. F2084L]MCK0097110.1 hypothetical protein [Yoonia sp. F2084L]
MNSYCEAFVHYVGSLGEQETPPDFVWDEWDVENYAEPIDDEEINSLFGISVNALLALGVAITFWPFTRLRASQLNPDAEHILECIACSSSQQPVFEYLMLDPDEWRGPSNGPVAVCIDALNLSVHEAEEVFVLAENTFMILQIARRATSASEAFEEWYVQAKKYLIEHHPSGAFDTLKDIPRIGTPVALSELMFDKSEDFSFEDQQNALSPNNPFREI